MDKLHISLIFDAIDNATKNIDGISGHLTTLRNEFKKQEKEINLQINAAKAIQALETTKAKVVELDREMQNAQTESTRLGQVYSATGKEVDHLGIQLALAKKALADMKSAGVSKSDNGFAALQADINELESSLKRSQATLKSQGKEFSAAEKEATKLANAIDKQTQSIAKQEDKLKSSGVDINHLSDEYKRLEVETAKATKALEQQIITAAKLKTLSDAKSTLGINSEKTTAEIRKIQLAYDLLAKSGTMTTAELTKAQEGMRSKIAELNGEVSKTPSHFTRIAASIGSLVVGIGILSKMKEAISSVLETGGKFESLAVSLKTVMGTAEAGEQAFAWIKQFAKDTPLELEGVSQAFIRLKAYGIDPMDGSLQALVDQNAKMSGSQETLMGMIMAVGQAWTKQKLQAEEVNQLIERGVPVWDLLAKVTGKSTAEIMKMSQAGAIGRTEIKALMEEIGRSSAGASAEQMKTWGGLISNLKDNWTQFLDSIASSGTLDFFKEKIKEINQAFNDMAKSGELQAKAYELSQAIKGVGIVAESAASLVAAGWRKVQIGGIYIAEYVALVEAAWERLRGGKLFKVDAAAIHADFQQQIADIKNGSDEIKKQAAAVAELDDAHVKIANSLINGADAMRGFLKESDKLTGFTAAMQSVKTGTQDAEKSWAEYVATVKGSDLAELISESTKKMAEFGPIIGQNSDKMKEWQSVIDTSIHESIKRLGVDADLVLTGIGKGFKDSLTELDDFSKAWTASGKSADDAGKIMVAALVKMVDKAKSTTELDELGNRFKALSQGVSAGMPIYQELTAAFVKIHEAQQKLNPATYELAAAQNQAKASAEALFAKFQEGSATAADYAKAAADAAKANDLVKGSAQGAAAATGTLTTAQHVANSVAKEKAAHNATVRAVNNQMAAERTAQAAAKHQQDQTEIHDGEVLTIGLEDRIAKLFTYGELGRKTMEDISRWAGWIWNFNDDLKLVEHWLDLARQQEETVGLVTQRLVLAAQSGKGLAVALNAASEGFDHLDDARLDGLNAALDAAKRKMQELQEAAENTRRSLADELDQLLGNQAAIEQRKYQAQIDDLQNKLEQARGIGDQKTLSNLQASLDMAQQIHDLNLKKINDEAKAKGTETNTVINNPITGSSGLTPINIFLDKQKAIVYAAEEKQKDSLLNMLKKASLTSS